MIPTNVQHAGERDPWTAGRADSYYRRARIPNYSENGMKVYRLTPEQMAEYEAGYAENEADHNFKDWD